MDLASGNANEVFAHKKSLIFPFKFFDSFFVRRQNWHHHQILKTILMLRMAVECTWQVTDAINFSFCQRSLEVAE